MFQADNVCAKHTGQREMQFGTCWGTHWKLSEHSENTLRTWWEHKNHLKLWSVNRRKFHWSQWGNKVAVFKYANKVTDFKYAFTPVEKARRLTPTSPPRPPKWTNENPTTRKKTVTLVGFTILHQQRKPKAGVTNLSTTANWASVSICRSTDSQLQVAIQRIRSNNKNWT
jgi:hypothetical protein